MVTDPGFSRYVQSLSNKGRLDRDTERRLAERWVATRDPEAGRVLVETHLLFVVKVASGFAGYGIPVADLVSEGNVGLLEALERFDPARNVRFISYAVWWIRAFMLAYIQRHWSLVHFPLSTERSKLFFRLNRERARVTSALGATAAPDEIEQIVARNLDSSRKHVAEMIANLDRRDVSLDAPLTVDGPNTRVTMLVRESEGHEGELARIEREEVVRDKVGAIEPGLPPRERYLLRHRLLSDEPEPLADIGRRFGVSRERVRQIELRLKKKLQKALAELAPERNAA